MEPLVKHITRLLEHLHALPFNLKFKPGKEMMASNVLSRLPIDEISNGHDVIPLYITT